MVLAGEVVEVLDFNGVIFNGKYKKVDYRNLVILKLLRSIFLISNLKSHVKYCLVEPEIQITQEYWPLCANLKSLAFGSSFRFFDDKI
jgi:hypothetical protein